MKETKEFQPHLLRIEGSIEWTCPICETYNGTEWQLPKTCRECGALFEWKVVVHYSKIEDSELS